MENTHFYEVSAEWKSEKKGKLNAENLPEVEVATPPQFPGGHEGIWSPEHLFVASVNSCIMTTFLAIAENSRLAFTSYASIAKGKLEKVDGKFEFTQIEVEASVRVSEEKDIARAERILHKAEAACLISNSIKTEVKMKPEVSLV